jgi:hypothetical protein
VPRISFFYGIAILMFWNEGRHARPHVHARYAGQAASIDLDGNVIAGSLRAGRSGSSPTGPSCTARSCSPNRERAARRVASADRPALVDLVTVEQLVDVMAVEVVGDYRLRLTFADGTVGEVDLGDRDWQGVFEPLRDPTYFSRVRIDPEAGTIAWPNGTDMAPEPLYEEARRNPVHPTPSTS